MESNTDGAEQLGLIRVFLSLQSATVHRTRLLTTSLSDPDPHFQRRNFDWTGHYPWTWEPGRETGVQSRNRAPEATPVGCKGSAQSTGTGKTAQ